MSNEKSSKVVVRTRSKATMKTHKAKVEFYPADAHGTVPRSRVRFENPNNILRFDTAR